MSPFWNNMAAKTVNRQLNLTRSNNCYFFDFYFYSFSTVWNSKSLLFSTLLIILKWILKKLNEADTYLYFLTVQKVTVSLPTKCLRNPTSGSALIGDIPVFSRHFVPKRGHQPPQYKSDCD